MDDGSSNAPVIHNNAIQVYYTHGGTLQAAWGTAPYNFNVLPLDGPGPGDIAPRRTR